ncbi:hypothetical protein EMIHUDRAFT_69768 [Emiliania huxleyi CCMP1516]|uniref:Gelsolin-like domain-containing protein n=4 Tax=Emiliania huxleyi TaxID=2903 RepID=A0A0D3JCX7_EMIH1|nr:hypothetical protein EMIHUDRAFT_74969 [Emiliania huxleyi CCMP1516]XP_005792843.1 hypothetical protein EMIHUDRAFT_69768 [Emiliania huxleyi CCMP1516]EOD21362.1 hypothetical protein EMIHUDRAFT_74969 [Emiliania huxleyi CCMP1516]EOD40414.1 hypothetical protein EMIHUDRAFT_69768 [Emiliania huxleyi CCMP1516]|eukprot:XP_005773791.1 hypothetical protein EMIHUDRAFT_74969 [Emiliania huxleyi CCMP1516]
MPKQLDWQDTNLANFGSEIERKCKAAAADGEPQWIDVGKSAGIQVWRMEQFKVVPWPKYKYGRFHRGDSYIVLRTYLKDPASMKLDHDVHFWIGSESTQDEYGTAAYKTVELDDKLSGRAVQYREVEGGESDRFARLFPQGLRYLAGGTASGFKHVDDAAEREPVLLRIKGLAGNVAMRQVKLSRTVMNSGDCYVMDTPQCIYQWNGKESSAHERAKASELCRLLQQDKHRDTKVLDEGTPEGDGTSPECSNHGFWRHLPGERRFLGLRVSRISIQDESAGGSDGDVKAFEPLLLKVTADGDTPHFRVVWRGKAPPSSRLDSSRVMLLDDGFQCFCWIGKDAPREARTTAFMLAQLYLKKWKRPSVLPVTLLKEGQEKKAFSALLGPAEPAAEGCGCVIS